MYPLALVTTTLGIGLARLVLDRVVARLRRTGRLPRAAVLVLGTGPLAVNLAMRIRNHAYLGMRVVAWCRRRATRPGRRSEGFRIVGEFARIRELIREHDADEVIVAQPNLAPQEILDFLSSATRNWRASVWSPTSSRRSCRRWAWSRSTASRFSA